MPRPKGGAHLLSDRRRRALALLESGLSLNEVARRIRCVASSVMRWRDAWQRHGADALQVGASPGRPPKLKAAQRRRLLRVLLEGPLAHGYNTNVWTTARIAEVIAREFGVSYHRDHVGRLMHSLDWSPAKPEKCVVERDEGAIGRRKEDRPRVGKASRG
ncbi:MAG: winged helix-turn-helix domain-containing protein [Bryobacteraceae bacterium]